MEYYEETWQCLPTRTNFFISSAGKIESLHEFKLNFLSSCFIVDGSHVKIVWLHVVVFNEHDICIFEIMSHCLHIIPWNYLKTSSILLITQVKPAYKFQDFRLHYTGKKTDLKFSQIVEMKLRCDILA